MITDLYHPYQDPGDNLDLIMGYALPEIDLKAVILDITDAFRKPVADHPALWKDPFGPREAGIIPVMQLNYIFDRHVPFALGPMSPMRSETDKMNHIPAFQQEGVNLLLRTLGQSKVPVTIISFGSARVLAVALNRQPGLMREKVKTVYLNAGTAAHNYKRSKDQDSNVIPGGEWNVALDVFAFTRMLRSDLSLALYPCAGQDGAFKKDTNNTYWSLPSLAFLNEADLRLRRYIWFALTKSKRVDFLRAMDVSVPLETDTSAYPHPFHVWETPLWMDVTGRKLVYIKDEGYHLQVPNRTTPADNSVGSSLIPVILNVRDDGRFTFDVTTKPSHKWIYQRQNPELQEKALQEAVPKLFLTFKTQ